MNSQAVEALLWNGINPPEPLPEFFRTTCPKCSATRRKRRQRCLVVITDDDRVRWYCHHCGYDDEEWFVVAKPIGRL
jgi:hypothetical protein